MIDIKCFKRFLVPFFAVLFLSIGGNGKAALEPDITQLLDDALLAEHRTPAYIERDVFRHPKETLLFFGLKPESSVVEITPSMGWYTEILAPVLHDNGQYYYASYRLHDDINPVFVKLENNFKEKIESNADVYGNLKWIRFDPNEPEFAPDGPVDMVLTFRNVHNWAKAGTAESMFDGFALALKQGGVLGIVEHRAKPGTPFEKQIGSGYMTVEYVVQLAEDAGFRLDASSEINANSKDTADHPGGVWNLLPNLRNVADEDKAAIIAIGESDRMTLRFVKE
ncbi:MAG: methyltransferase [Proteobacteria bacterium]|nr:methyltransferase [Pseudomonadota bacterium]MDA1332098.1 methyltransferase [Pseudomonadota bacterium]